MTGQLLSQEEIDALMSGLSDGDLDVSMEEAIAEEQTSSLEFKSSELEKYDFLRRGVTKKEVFPALNFIYDRFAKSFRSALTILVEKEIEIDLASSKNIKYADFIAMLPLPTNMNVVVTENLKGFFIIIFDTKIIFSVLETMFGSISPSFTRIEGREFTRIEISVIKKLVDVVSVEMEKAWAPVYEIQCRYSRSEMNPNYITMVAKDETVNVCNLKIDVGEISGWIKICIPYSILDNIKGHLTTSPSREDADMREKWFNLLGSRTKEVSLDVAAILGSTKISLRECQKLMPRDVILLNRHAGDPVDIEVEGNPKFLGKIGASHGNKAVQFEGVATKT